jgi:hypothetical protein
MVNYEPQNNFLKWLSGFVDGEGFFSIFLITKKLGAKEHARYQPCFGINLRNDDSDILHEIKEKLGFGQSISTRHKSRRLTDNRGSEYQTNPTVEFRVASIKDCLKLVEIFRQFPLRTRKRLVFEVWAEAVKELAKGKSKNLTLIESYCNTIKMLRRYYPLPEIPNIISQVEDYLNSSAEANKNKEEVK